MRKNNLIKCIFFRVSEDFIYENNIVLRSSYKNASNLMKSPLSASAKENDGLILKIKRNNDILKEDICLENSFIVHGHDESPLKFHITDACEYEFGTSMDVIITPVVIKTEENLRSFTPERRHCYFDDERKLKYYKKYSKTKCEMECVSNYTFKICHCIPYDIIRDKNTTVCGINTIDCTKAADYKVKYEPRSELIAQCNCLPTCNSIKYNVEYIQTKLNPNFDKLEV